MKVTAYKKINSYEGRSIPELVENLLCTIKVIDKENPDWKEDRNYWLVSGDYDDVKYSHIALYYQREETDEEKDKRKRMVSESIQRDKDTLKRLMEKYPEEVLKNLK